VGVVSLEWKKTDGKEGEKEKRMNQKEGESSM